MWRKQGEESDRDDNRRAEEDDTRRGKSLRAGGQWRREYEDTGERGNWRPNNREQPGDWREWGGQRGPRTHWEWKQSEGDATEGRRMESDQRGRFEGEREIQKLERSTLPGYGNGTTKDKRAMKEWSGYDTEEHARPVQRGGGGDDYQYHREGGGLRGDDWKHQTYTRPYNRQNITPRPQTETQRRAEEPHKCNCMGPNSNAHHDNRRKEVETVRHMDTPYARDPQPIAHYRERRQNHSPRHTTDYANTRRHQSPPYTINNKNAPRNRSPQYTTYIGEAWHYHNPQHNPRYEATTEHPYPPPPRRDRARGREERRCEGKREESWTTAQRGIAGRARGTEGEPNYREETHNINHVNRPPPVRGEEDYYRQPRRRQEGAGKSTYQEIRDPSEGDRENRYRQQGGEQEGIARGEQGRTGSRWDGERRTRTPQQEGRPPDIRRKGQEGEQAQDPQKNWTREGEQKEDGQRHRWEAKEEPYNQRRRIASIERHMVAIGRLWTGPLPHPAEESEQEQGQIWQVGVGTNSWNGQHAPQQPTGGTQQQARREPRGATWQREADTPQGEDHRCTRGRDREERRRPHAQAETGHDREKQGPLGSDRREIEHIKNIWGKLEGEGLIERGGRIDHPARKPEDRKHPQAGPLETQTLTSNNGPNHQRQVNEARPHQTRTRETDKKKQEERPQEQQRARQWGNQNHILDNGRVENRRSITPDRGKEQKEGIKRPTGEGNEAGASKFGEQEKHREWEAHKARMWKALHAYGKRITKHEWQTYIIKVHRALQAVYNQNTTTRRPNNEPHRSTNTTEASEHRKTERRYTPASEREQGHHEQSRREPDKPHTEDRQKNNRERDVDEETNTMRQREQAALLDRPPHRTQDIEGKRPTAPPQDTKQKDPWRKEVQQREEHTKAQEKRTDIRQNTAQAKGGDTHTGNTDTTGTREATPHIKYKTTLKLAWMWKARLAHNTLTEETFKERENINYYTNTRAGPPAYLTDSQKQAWNKEIQQTKERCRRDILIPALEEKTRYWNTIRHSTPATKPVIKAAIDASITEVWNLWKKKGLSNGNIAKIFKEANIYEEFIPEPPPAVGTPRLHHQGQDTPHEQISLVRITTDSETPRPGEKGNGTRDTAPSTGVSRGDTRGKRTDTGDRKETEGPIGAMRREDTRQPEDKGRGGRWEANIEEIDLTEVLIALETHPEQNSTQPHTRETTGEREPEREKEGDQGHENPQTARRTGEGEERERDILQVPREEREDSKEKKEATRGKGEIERAMQEGTPKKGGTEHTTTKEKIDLGSLIEEIDLTPFLEADAEEDPTKYTEKKITREHHQGGKDEGERENELGETQTKARPGGRTDTKYTSGEEEVGETNNGCKEDQGVIITITPTQTPDRTATPPRHHSDTNRDQPVEKDPPRRLENTVMKRKEVNQPDRHLSPITVETPREHYTLRPRPKTSYTRRNRPVTPKDSEAAHTTHTTQNPDTRNQNHKHVIDLTKNTSQESNRAPREKEADEREEEDITFYTPERLIVTPRDTKGTLNHRTAPQIKIEIRRTPPQLRPRPEKTKAEEGQTQPQRQQASRVERQKASQVKTPTTTKRRQTRETSQETPTQQKTNTQGQENPTQERRLEGGGGNKKLDHIPHNKETTRTAGKGKIPPRSKEQTQERENGKRDTNRNGTEDSQAASRKRNNNEHVKAHTDQTTDRETHTRQEQDKGTEVVDQQTQGRKTDQRGEKREREGRTENKTRATPRETHSQDRDTTEKHEDTPDGGHDQGIREDPEDTDIEDMIRKLVAIAIERHAQEADTHPTIQPPRGTQGQTQEQEDVGTGEGTGRKRLKNLLRKYQREKKKEREGKGGRPKLTRPQAETPPDTVFDYTTGSLTTVEKQVLGLGKSFIITQNGIDIDRIKTDIATYIRRLRLHYIFRERKPDNAPHNLDINRKHRQIQKDKAPQNTNHMQWRKPKSLFQPEETQRDINQIERNLETSIATQLAQRKRAGPNIPREWKTAIDTLKTKVAERQITITQADKGGGIIVVDHDTYIRKGTQYIEEEANAYEQVHTQEKTIIEELTKERQRVTNALKDTDTIPIDTATYATHQTIEKITGMKFYYKVHKTTDIHTMPVRPLQSCIGGPTQHLSQVLTDIYKPYINDQHIPTYIRDTNHTLYELDGTTLKDTDTLAIADVVALYPSIVHEKGLEAVETFTREHVHQDEQKIRALVQAFKLVITRNYVKWQGKIYRQTTGVAMGTPVAVTYANIYMNAIDKKIASRCPYIKLHRRFIDDNLFIVPISKKQEFQQTLNTIEPPHIRFTVEHLGDPPHTDTLPFLDITFYLGAQREVYTRLYTKNTDKHQYLLPHSQHPKHIIRNIPRGVFARIRRLCKDTGAYMEDSAKAIVWLKERGYREDILTKLRNDTALRCRWQMIKDIEAKEGNKHKQEDMITDIPFINTYSEPTKGFAKTLHDQRKALEDIFKRAKMRTLNAYRRKPNLGDMLIQPSLRIPIEGENTAVRTFSKCGKHLHTKPCPCKGRHNQTLCRLCAHIAQEDITTKPKITRAISCDSKNIIYMIWCDACSMTYIGETQQKIRERFTQHLHNLDAQDQELYNHFRQPGHRAAYMRIAILETLQHDEPIYRKIRESTWIRNLKTYTPHGLNSKMKESPLDMIRR